MGVGILFLMNAFIKIIKKAAPIMASVQSLFLYVIFLSFLGYLIDNKFDSFPILFIAFLFIGLTLGFYHIQKVTNRGE